MLEAGCARRGAGGGAGAEEASLGTLSWALQLQALPYWPPLNRAVSWTSELGSEGQEAKAKKNWPGLGCSLEIGSSESRRVFSWSLLGSLEVITGRKVRTEERE